MLYHLLKQRVKTALVNYTYSVFELAFSKTAFNTAVSLGEK